MTRNLRILAFLVLAALIAVLAFFDDRLDDLEARFTPIERALLAPPPPREPPPVVRPEKRL